MNDYLKNAKWFHVAVSVRDMERSLAFYRDLLGFEVQWDFDHVTGGVIEAIVGLSDVDVRVVMLAGHGARVELFQYHHPKGEDRSAKRQCNFGFTHVALYVEDVLGAYAALDEKGVEFLSPPQNHRPDGWVVYMKDPDGNIVELVNPGEAI
jgi:glyoxylase I family protein